MQHRMQISITVGKNIMICIYSSNIYSHPPPQVQGTELHTMYVMVRFKIIKMKACHQKQIVTKMKAVKCFGKTEKMIIIKNQKGKVRGKTSRKTYIKLTAFFIFANRETWHTQSEDKGEMGIHNPKIKNKEFRLQR